MANQDLNGTSQKTSAGQGQWKAQVRTAKSLRIIKGKNGNGQVSTTQYGGDKKVLIIGAGN